MTSRSVGVLAWCRAIMGAIVELKRAHSPGDTCGSTAVTTYVSTLPVAYASFFSPMLPVRHPYIVPAEDSQEYVGLV